MDDERTRYGCHFARFACLLFFIIFFRNRMTMDESSTGRRIDGKVPQPRDCEATQSFRCVLALAYG